MYFKEEEVVDFIPTGSTLLDCALGGGWARGRVSNPQVKVFWQSKLWDII